MFKSLSNLAGLFKQAQQITGQMDKLAEEMKGRRTTGTAGGGMVTVEINGLLEVLQCRIDPQLFAQGDRELIEDLVVAAVNQAVDRGKQMHASAVREITGGLQLPGLEETLQKFVGSGGAAADDKETGGSGGK
jgi:nucleoid-associated protein EbfC